MNLRLLSFAALVGRAVCDEPQAEAGAPPRRLRASGSEVKQSVSASRRQAVRRAIALKAKAREMAGSYDDDYFDDAFDPFECMSFSFSFSFFWDDDYTSEDGSMSMAADEEGESAEAPALDEEEAEESNAKVYAIE